MLTSPRDWKASATPGRRLIFSKSSPGTTVSAKRPTRSSTLSAGKRLKKLVDEYSGWFAGLPAQMAKSLIFGTLISDRKDSLRHREKSSVARPGPRPSPHGSPQRGAGSADQVQGNLRRDVRDVAVEVLPLRTDDGDVLGIAGELPGNLGGQPALEGCHQPHEP